jgi:hypothetical protein
MDVYFQDLLDMQEKATAEMDGLRLGSPRIF